MRPGSSWGCVCRAPRQSSLRSKCRMASVGAREAASVTRRRGGFASAAADRARIKCSASLRARGEVGDAGEHARTVGQRADRPALDDRGAGAAGAGAGGHHHGLGRSRHGPERLLQHPQDERHRDLPVGARPARLALVASGAAAAGGHARLAGEARAHDAWAPLHRPVPDADHRLPSHRDGRLSGAVLHAVRPRAFGAVEQAGGGGVQLRPFHAAVRALCHGAAARGGRAAASLRAQGQRAAPDALVHRATAGHGALRPGQAPGRAVVWPASATGSKEMKAGEAIAEILKREGVEIIFGYPVNHILEYAARAGIRPIIVRQERVGLHMADAMSRLTSGKKIGVFAMQHGPGAENAYGGIAQAYDEAVAEPLAYTPAAMPRIGPDPEAVRVVAKRLADAKRPVIYAGQGVHYARACAELKQLAELLAAPVTTSLGGKSAFPENHMLALGSGGNAIPAPVHHFLHDADLIFGIGCSFTKTNFGVDMPPS